MSRDTTVIPFRQPDAIDDPLSEVAREGARRMLAQVLIAEADAFVAQWKDLKLPDGRDRVVRHGHGPQRAIQTGIGPVEVRRAKVRDRADVETDQKIRFTSAILLSQPATVSRVLIGPRRRLRQYECATVCLPGSYKTLILRAATRLTIHISGCDVRGSF
jgi:hypothetical protein